MRNCVQRRVGVVIPYYQREQGLLRRALQSVATQSLPPDVRMTIVVVDDESPWPAEKEVAGLAWPPSCELIVTRQLNGGPAAARNTGIEQFGLGKVDYVAFLDSDDTWFPQHISTALDFLRDSDFYFANCIRGDVDRFQFQPWILQNHVRKGRGVYEPPTGSLSGDDAFETLLRHCLPGTPWVVYDYKHHGGLRFDEDQSLQPKITSFGLS